MASRRVDRRPRGLGHESAPASSIKLPLIIVLVLVVTAVGGYFAYDWHLKREQDEYRSQRESEARAVAQRLAIGVRGMTAPLDAAIDPVTLGALLNSGDDEGVAEKISEITAVDENVISARVLKPGYSQIDYDATPPLGYATLDLLRRSEKDGKAPPMEVHLKGQDSEHIAALRRIEGAEGLLLGHLIIFLKLDALDAAAARLKTIEGYAELQQTVSAGRPLILARMGNPSYRNPTPLLTFPIPDSAWRLVYWSEPAPKRMEPLADLPLAQIGAALAALLLGVFILARLRRRRAGAKDANGEPKAAVVGGEAVASGIGAPAPDKVSVRKVVTVAPAAPADGGIEVHETGAEDRAGAKDSHAAGAAPAQSAAAAARPQAAASGAPTKLPATIFRAYDIRGVVKQSLTPEVVRVIGRAIGSEADALGQKKIVVGRDGRTSSPRLAETLIEGLRSSGREVIDIGQVPTPLVYFATHYLETGSGVMVTGSHNPPEYNGLKIMLNGETLFGDRIAALRTRAQAGDFVSGDGGLQTTEILSEYIRRVCEDVPVALGNAFKVVVDCGNGVAGAVAPQLIRALGHDVVELYCEVDGNFPNHHPDPSVPANLKDLIAAVKENAADIGFAFDGDGDRLGVVDGNGSIIYPDRQLMLFARDVLSRNPGAEIVFDVKCSSRLPMVIQKLGGKPVMWKTGHSFIKGKLKETGAPLAGEMSGHIFFKERWYGFDDALYAAARLLEILMGLKQPPAEIFKKLPKGVATPELRVDLAEGEHLAFMEKLKQSSSFGDAKLTTIDGLRVDFADSWGLVRASNTTPSLVLRFEGDSKEALNRIGGLFKKTLLEIDPELKLPF
ncbi:MAG TPA: phosphomannomutase/phosphoglucomutase [Gammaproteobacteria bacterium]|nr:phosphomannomutase/phosphoglucomutase [Gammaproteobacteria bacterium]